MNNRLRFIVLVLVAGLIFTGSLVYFLSRGGVKPTADYTDVSCRIDEIVKKELIKAGVTDADVVNCFREEKREGNTSWLKITKEVNVPETVIFENWQKDLMDSLRYMGADIYGATPDAEKDSLTLEIGKKKIVTQVVTLRHKSAAKYRVSIVIDDLGNRKESVKKFTALNVPLTFSILPLTAFSASLATELKKAGYEIMLHLPMESVDYPNVKPGPGAIMMSMTPSQVTDTIIKGLKTVPGAAGASNHQGSRLMASREKVKQAVSVFKEKGMFFFDSKTTPDSAGESIARQMNVKTASNDVFLDNRDDYDYIAGQFEKLLAFVKKNGRGIAIGHVNRENTPRVLADYIPKFKKAGINFVYLSELLD